MVRRVVGSIPLGGPIELSHYSYCITTCVTKTGMCCIVICLLDGVYKRSHAASWKEYHHIKGCR